MDLHLSTPIVIETRDRREREVAELGRERALRRTGREGLPGRHVSLLARIRRLRQHAKDHDTAIARPHNGAKVLKDAAKFPAQGHSE